VRTCASVHRIWTRFSAAIRRDDSSFMTPRLAQEYPTVLLPVRGARHHSKQLLGGSRAVTIRPNGWELGESLGETVELQPDGSITKSRGSWTHKFGRMAQPSVQLYRRGKTTALIGGTGNVGQFQFQYVTANGAQPRRTPTTAERASTAPHCCWGSSWWSARAPTPCWRSRRSILPYTRKMTGAPAPG